METDKAVHLEREDSHAYVSGYGGQAGKAPVGARGQTGGSPLLASRLRLWVSRGLPTPTLTLLMIFSWVLSVGTRSIR